METIDLHVHSSFSDGSMTPSELVALAFEKNLKAFALTDHDTVAGIREAKEAVKKYNEELALHPANRRNPLIFVPGVEISAIYENQDIHILGYGIDELCEPFLSELAYYRSQREQPNAKMIGKLQEQGFYVTPEQVIDRFGADTVITRAHYAILLTEGGYVSDNNEAFEKYLNPGCPCYLPRERISVTDAVKLVLKAGGKPVLAHPLLYKLSEEKREELVILLKKNGLMGLEAIYCKNQGDDELRMKTLAGRHELFITGGSDFHGTAKPGLAMGTGYGNLCVPAELLSNVL